MASQLKYYIYKLCCSDITITDTYVGSTKNFAVRKNNHKSNCKNELSAKYNIRVYQFIRENGGWDNWDMIEIEIIYVDSKKEAERRERYWIETLQATLNCNIPSRPKIERDTLYREEHKEELKEYNKKYQEEHKEELKEQKASYYKDNIDYFKDKAANYYEEHKDELIEKNKQYRIDNPDCRKKKIICECGAEVLAEGLRAHLMTDIHAERMKPDYVEPEPFDEKKYQAEKYQKNKEQIKIYRAKLIQCECMFYITTGNKAAHLKSSNHTKQMELVKLGDKNITHTLCECGIFVQNTNSHGQSVGMKNHLKTKKHKQLMEQM
jgi:hypothetical protein